MEPHKLAVHEQGGHSDWHRDTTHGDNHHGTVLIALNTSWKGGDLYLRHRGVETSFDMQPRKPSGAGGKAGATSGSRMHSPIGKKPYPNVTRCIQLEWRYNKFLNDPYDYRSPIDPTQFEIPDTTVENEETLIRLNNLLTNEFSPRIEEVGFPLRHLYRRQSILPHYLKGVAALIYQHFLNSNFFNISLHPIMLTAETTRDQDLYPGDDSTCAVIKYPIDLLEQGTPSSYITDSSDSNTTTTDDSTRFFLYDTLDVRLIYKKEWVDNAGNEPQEGSCRYFGGGMYLRLKEQPGEDK
ncbi:hypothetical protein F5890DRAFT_1558547 [Lentinula detonsa]|uniref:Fe2OG dioxygenase domain-containing protein n=1 Tax=Lentinula detonsa TaxID=2804962 RepID=A0AA38PQS4_9AGAR|nr:hypothetical protein F5890DRAFT_1558547 [Lentinula detonsa]